MLIIGVGNPFRRDDGVGPAIASAVKALGIAGLRVLIRMGEGADLIECWNPDEDVIVVDAMRSGAVPGTIIRIDAREKALPVEHFNISSHSFGVAEAVEVARALDRLPRSLVIYGIEAEDMVDGEGFSPGVEGSIDKAVGMIMEEISGGK